MAQKLMLLKLNKSTSFSYCFFLMNDSLFLNLLIVCLKIPVLLLKYSHNENSHFTFLCVLNTIANIKIFI